MRLSAPTMLLASLLLAGCASASRDGRVQLVAPATLSTVYSTVDMQVKLATAADFPTPGYAARSCPPTGCDAPQDFERKVFELGDRLSLSAYELFPDLGERIPKFAFAVARKVEAGTLSDADGAVVVLDGVRRMGLSDDALSFVIAREMGHVIGRHHDEDSATSILFSVAAGLLLPMANLIRGAAAIVPGSATASATATAASLAGSGMMRAGYREDQLREADQIAVEVLAKAGSELHDVADTLAAGTVRFADDEWSRDLRISFQRLEQLAFGPRRKLQEVQAEATVSMDPVRAD